MPSLVDVPDVLAALQAQFDVTKPLAANDPRYRNWTAAIGLGDPVQEVRRILSRAASPVTVLLTGQRGTGKSSDLNRLEANLADGAPGDRFWVAKVSVAERLGDLVQVTAPVLLFELARALVAQLDAVGAPVRSALERFLDGLKARLRGVEVDWSPPFGHGLSVAFKDQPSARAQILQSLEQELPDLQRTVNQAVLPAARDFASARGCKDVVLVVDDLDHVDEFGGDQAAGRLFLQGAPALRSFSCSIVYTVPVGLAFGNRYQHLRDLFTHVVELGYLPVLARDTVDSPLAVAAREQVAAIVGARLDAAGTDVASVFGGDHEVLRLARVSGGNLRTLFRLVTTALSKVDELPLTPVLGLAVRLDSKGLGRHLTDEARRVLAGVHESQQPPGAQADQQAFADLVSSGCVLAYRDPDGATWYDRHPLLAEGHDGSA